MTIRLSLVTLGVADVARSTAFYERLGATIGPTSNAHVTFFDMNGVILALWDWAALAEDARVDAAGSGFSGVTLAWNRESREAVDAGLTAAEAAGGRIVKPAEAVFWGGYSGYFSDPDGHLWEVAHNPFFPIDAEGVVRLAGGENGAA